MESIIESKEVLSRGNIAYGIGHGAEEEGIFYFDLDDPGNITWLFPMQLPFLLSGGTWSCYNKIYACEYNSGSIWVIDLETGDMSNIGGGGTPCNDLAWDPINDRLYGVSGTDLYEYNPITGEQDFIGSFDWGNLIRGIAIDSEGVAYIWDVLLNGSSTLLSVDLETCKVTEIGELGISLLYCGIGHFDYETDILYFISYSEETMLIECDEDTGNCTLVGDFKIEIIDCFVIPYDCSNSPPEAPTIRGKWRVKELGTYDYKFKAIDPDGDDIRYLIDWGDDSDKEWTDYYASGEEIIVNHTWDKFGVIMILARANDTHGALGPWGTLEWRSKSTNNNNKIEPDKQKVDYDYAIIGGYYQYSEHKGFILWRDVYLGAGDFDLYLYIDFYRFPDFHVHHEDFLTRVTADYLIWLTWLHGGFYDSKAIAFGNIEWS
jgi:hypothetical protein